MPPTPKIEKIKTDALTPRTLIDNTHQTWLQPIVPQAERTNLYWSFSYPPALGVPASFTISLDKKTKGLVRELLSEVSGYLNVNFIEVDNLQELPKNSRKFAFAASKYLPNPMTYEEYIEIIKTGKEQNVRSRQGTSFCFATDENGKSYPLAKDQGGADTKLVVLPKDLLKNTNAAYAKFIIGHELGHVLGLRDACEAIVTDKITTGVIKQQHEQEANYQCSQDLQNDSIMVYPEKGNTDLCVIGRTGQNSINPQNYHLLRNAFMECSYGGYDSPVFRPADINAFNNLFGPVQNPAYPQPSSKTMAINTDGAESWNFTPPAAAMLIGVTAGYFMKQLQPKLSRNALYAACATTALLLAAGVSEEPIANIMFSSIVAASSFVAAYHLSTAPQGRHGRAHR